MLKARVIRMVDETPFNDDGSTRQERVVTFFVDRDQGRPLGPFTERFAAADYSAAAWTERLGRLLTELQQMSVE